MKPKVTIIILNFNGVEDTKECLTSLFKTKYKNFNIVVVDNGSEKDESEILSKKFKSKKIQFLRFNKNFGFAEGNNKIIRKIKSKYAVLLNNDTIVDKNWLEELVKVAETDKKIAACQGKIRSFYNPDYFEYAGAAGGFLDRLGYPYTRGRIGFHVEKDDGQYDDKSEIFWGSGTCLLLRRKHLKKSGLLPKDFFFYHEETDLCWRLRKLGFRIVFAPNSIIYHKGAASSKKNLDKRVYYVHRNNLMLITRNAELEKLIWILPMRMLLDIMSAMFYCFLGRPSFMLSLIRAELSFLRRFPAIIKRRSKKEKINSSCSEFMHPFSIYFEYFIRRKKRYTQILKKPAISHTLYYKDYLNVLPFVDKKKKIQIYFNSFINFINK